MPPKTIASISEFERARVGFLCNPKGAGTRYSHLRKFIDLVWKDSDITWNPWLEDQLQTLCDDSYIYKQGDVTIRFVSWTGPGAAGKTFSSGLYAASWFLAAPQKSSVSFTSTSKQAMGGRVWSVMANLFLGSVHPDTEEAFDWHIVNSKKVIQFPKGNEKHNIACFAVEEGEVLKSVDRIKGRHTERMLLIVDEANSTPEAIFKVIPNMRKGCRELVVLVFDNAGNMYGNHGRCCEPQAGWSSISVDDERWITKGVEEWGLPPGICRHYDGEKSPNVLAGRTLYPHIYSFEDWQTALKSGADSLHYWSQDRGFWPPEGATNTVFSGPLITRCDGSGFVEIVSNKETYAFLDPGFGGDRCVLQLADVGDMEIGKKGIQLRDPIYIVPKVDIEAERDYQIARQVIEICKANSVRAAHYGGDATAVGRGVHAIIAGEWSQEVQRVEWCGKASDKPSSQADGRPAHEVYNDRVTELWFCVREFMEAGQLKGLYPEAIKQFCSRVYTQAGRKFELVSKGDCRKTLGYSPDEGDAISGLCEVVRRNGITAEGKFVQTVSTYSTEVVHASEERLALNEPAINAVPDLGGWAEHDPSVRIDWKDSIY